MTTSSARMSTQRTAETLAALEGIAQTAAQLIGPPFDQAGACFALLGFDKGDGGWATYVSNAERDCMVKALREMADTLERGLDHKPGAPGSGIVQ